MGVLFFAALVVGALTSAVSIFEVVAATAIEQLGWSRTKAATAVGAAAAAFGVVPALSTEALTVMDDIAGNILLIAGSLGLAVFLGWRLRVPAEDLYPEAIGSAWLAPWRFALRWLVPPALAVVLAYSLFRVVGGWLG